MYIYHIHPLPEVTDEGDLMPWQMAGELEPMYVYINVLYIYIYREREMYMYIGVYIYVIIYIYRERYIRMYVHIYIYIERERDLCVYVCMRVFMYVYIYIEREIERYAYGMPWQMAGELEPPGLHGDVRTHGSFLIRRKRGHPGVQGWAVRATQRGPDYPDCKRISRCCCWTSQPRQVSTLPIVEDALRSGLRSPNISESSSVLRTPPCSPHRAPPSCLPPSMENWPCKRGRGEEHRWSWLNQPMNEMGLGLTVGVSTRTLHFGGPRLW